MNATAIRITGVERKEGVSQKTGKPWTKYIVQADGGANYATFDAGLANVAIGGVGEHAAITFEPTQYGNDLKSLIVEPADPEPAPVFTKAPTYTTDAVPMGDKPDWDLIGLRKTRCALWAALLPALASMPFDQAMVHGIQLVRGAEVDIFSREPAQPGDEIPF